MGGRHKPSIEPKAFVKLYEKHGSIKAVARALKKPYGGVQKAYHAALAEGLLHPVGMGAKSRDHLAAVAKGSLKVEEDDLPVLIEGSLRAKYAPPLPLKKRGITRFLFTSAQNNTKLHDRLWDNLLVFAKEIGATLHVSRFAYIKSGLGARGDKEHWFDYESEEHAKDIWFDGRIEPYILDQRVEVAPGLVFVGDANILPTASRPLSGYQTLTGRRSGIFPHVKFAMESVGTSSSTEPTKFNYTTGTVTQRNYIQRAVGLKAEFHHCYGCLLVEVDADGNWFCRQVNADSEGSFYELDPNGDGCMLVKNEKVTTGHRAEAFNAGDNHAEDEDHEVSKPTWGEGGLVDTVCPKYQFFNDVCSFNPRSHHAMKDPHVQFLHHVMGTESVRNQMKIVAKYLRETTRPFCVNVIVDSNHDRHIGRWIKEQDGRRDPVNARFWMDLNKLTYDFMQEHKAEPNHMRLALGLVDPMLERDLKLQFVDETFVICHDNGGGIECGMHGDRGVNGSRGSALNLAKMGRKANIGHSHVACIVDGIYQAGTSSKLRLSYNAGPTSWSQSHVLTYANGKRTIITIWQGKWRA